MSTKRLAVTVAAVAAAALVTMACSAATASTPAKPSRDTVHLTAYTNNDGPTETVILTGAVGDYGQAVSVHPDGSVDPEHDSQLELRLSHGTFRLDIAALDKAFVAAMAHQFPTNVATCSGSVTVSQRVPIVPGSGTGAYKAIGGDFALTIVLDEVDKTVPGAPCSVENAFLSQTLVTSGTGGVTL